MDREIANFIWSGKEDGQRPRVDRTIIHRPKEEGGLALIFVIDWTMAFVGKLVQEAC